MDQEEDRIAQVVDPQTGTLDPLPAAGPMRTRRLDPVDGEDNHHNPTLAAGATPARHLTISGTLALLTTGNQRSHGRIIKTVPQTSGETEGSL